MATKLGPQVVRRVRLTSLIGQLAMVCGRPPNHHCWCQLGNLEYTVLSPSI